MNMLLPDLILLMFIVTLSSDDLLESVVKEVKNNILSKVLTDFDESGSLLGVYY